LTNQSAKKPVPVYDFQLSSISVTFQSLALLYANVVVDKVIISEIVNFSFFFIKLAYFSELHQIMPYQQTYA